MISCIFCFDGYVSKKLLGLKFEKVFLNMNIYEICNIQYIICTHITHIVNI